MAESQSITLRELQRRVKSALEGQFALPVWVSAEISEIKVNYSGHCYLELVEKGGDNGVPTAQARAVMWRSHYPRISGYFEAETGQRLAAGIRILAKVLVSYHELYGFSLQITDIDPSYTLGDMERQRQQTIAQLQQEGVWDMNREAPMPAVVQRIAVVSSVHAAGYQDFCQELEKSPYRFEVSLFDAFMQGEAAEESIVAALCAVAEQLEKFDAVVLIRGGGSRSDLNCFNAYRLCAHVAQFPLPVVTGIGHDKDTSVADMVAHTALKTPTAVAGWLVERMAEADGWLDYAALQLHDATAAAMHASEVRLERLSGEVRRLSGELLTRQSLRLEHLGTLLPEAARDFLARQALRLENAAELIAGRSPERILRLGFAVLRAGGKAVTSAAGVTAGEDVEIEVSDGRISATVNSGKIWQKKS
ncbi:exodeoxyribonuclease VII large subunit [Alistipes sp.]|uniref:exodeoxyribonuclease VII large subunit n=1 Tax=Alistipes sp. TaxID=1872444 RepID=UPI003AB198C2